MATSLLLQLCLGHDILISSEVKRILVLMMHNIRSNTLRTFLENVLEFRGVLAIEVIISSFFLPR